MTSGPIGEAPSGASTMAGRRWATTAVQTSNDGEEKRDGVRRRRGLERGAAFNVVDDWTPAQPLASPAVDVDLVCISSNSTHAFVLDSPTQPQLLPVAGDWGSLYAAQEPVKAPRHVLVMPAASKKPAYGGGRRIKNLEMCTEALGCETGGVDTATATAADVVAEDDVVSAEAEGAERKRRAREEEEEGSLREGGRVRRALPPPLTTLARGGNRVRMVHERRDGRLAVYAVRTPGVQAERCGGRLRLRLVPCSGCSNAAECHQKEKQQAEDAKATTVLKEKEAAAATASADEAPEEDHTVAKYVRGGRCVEAEVAATAAARRGKKWEPEQAAAFWVATS
ncbi:hypothetical protein GUJ93_ZPchr0005g14389 [Zizania palustris]|uniref:FAF domain-containing protein n=1 Tax=Zizania palustris TaxID=103762 RepID=A0A8J5SXM7_ZIZPA|nr:hypothetical protein GUJ93_ZPchr0005g14389 [Zizania palustris]